MKKLVVFHPAIVPYRTDFFNSLNERFDAAFYFEFVDALEQSFAQDRLRENLDFVPQYLKPGLWGIKNLRLQVFSILKKETPDIVFCSEYNMLGLLVLIYKLLFNRKLRVFTICDDSKDIANSATLIKKCMRFISVTFYSGVILTNDNVMSWYIDHFHAKRKFLFFPIIQKDQKFRHSLEKALPIAGRMTDELQLKGRQVLLFVGRLIDIKNLLLLLDALASIVDRYPRTVLLLVGDGEQRSTLELHAEKKGIQDHVLFVGKKQGADLYAYYNIGQIFILPSYYERFGAVVNEALLAGCYTLCSSAAGAACLIDTPNNGAVFDPHDQTDLAEKLDYALANSLPFEYVYMKPNRMCKNYDQYMSDFYYMFHCSVDNNND